MVRLWGWKIKKMIPALLMWNILTLHQTLSFEPISAPPLVFDFACFSTETKERLWSQQISTLSSQCPLWKQPLLPPPQWCYCTTFTANKKDGNARFVLCASVLIWWCVIIIDHWLLRCTGTFSIFWETLFTFCVFKHKNTWCFLAWHF